MSLKQLQLAGLYDFGPHTMLKREYLINILQSTFKQYGFLPLHTPAIERLDVLIGKYGQEGDQLLFKILNSGDFLAKTTQQDYQQGSKTILPKIAKKGLRYDLTIPLARYLATHRNTITLPFKRFQIQPVWRAEKPQKNRYREFYQCDVDTIGTTSLLCEAEIFAMINQIAQHLHLPDLTIQLNHRLIFKTLAIQLQSPEKETLLCRTLDKLDKIGQDNVINLLLQQGFSTDQLKKINWIFHLQGNIHNTLPLLAQHINTLPQGQQILTDLQNLLHYTQALQLPPHLLSLTPTLARGMDYYTGLIFEIKTQGLDTSLGGGGRYDQLTTRFGLEPLPGIGFSFGLERLYNLLDKNNLIPDTHLTTTSLLLVPLTKQQEHTTLRHLHTLRQAGISTEIYPIPARLQKTFHYAQQKHIPWVAIIGEQEAKTNTISLKHLPTQQQTTCSPQDLIQRLKHT